MRKAFNSGFTLVEVLLSAAILVFVLCGILVTYISCLELSATARNLTYATNAIQRKIEEIRDYPFNNIAADYNDPALNKFFTVNEMLAGSNIGVVDVNNTVPDLLEVTISVCWRQRANRIIGEDDGRGGGTALDGALSGGEDLDGDGIVDSLAQLVTLITAR